MKQDALLLELPLSWARGPQKTTHVQSMPMLFRRTHWLSLAEIPETRSFNSIIDETLGVNKRIIIRGCTPLLAKQLEAKGFDTMPMGQEALFDLDENLPYKKSTRELIRRGQRQGHLKKIYLNAETLQKLQHLKNNSPHGREPQLRHLFWGDPLELSPAYIWVDPAGNWLAALTISHSSKQKAHTELMVRHRHAGVGCMEALVAATAASLKEDGFRFFSLGEVPFISANRKGKNFRDSLVSGAGKMMHFAYNPQSLYRFKEKFSPTWQDLYICGYPRISLSHLWAIAWHSRYLHLVGHSLRSSGLTLLLNFAFMAYS